MANEKPKPGKEPERLAIKGDWKKAVAKALRQERPEGGWPRKPRPKKPRRKS